MDQNVRHAVVGNNETIALGNVEPLDDPGDLDQVDGSIGLCV